MDITIYPQKLHGVIHAIPSKSQAHRLLICAAFADKTTELICPDTNQDIEATARCLQSLGARIVYTGKAYIISPIHNIPSSAILDCSESGSTLRFILPIAGALGVNATFRLSGRLPDRPLSPLWEEMERMGCSLSRPTKDTIQCCGSLKCGEYRISGNVSSQYITGLLFALSVMPGKSSLVIQGPVESKPYISMTLDALSRFNVNADCRFLGGKRPFRSPGSIAVEGDWSNGAFFLAAQAIGNPVSITGLNAQSHQGDRAAAAILENLDSTSEIDASHIPDLVPILAVAACCKKGAVFHNIRRLRLKESDRVQSVSNMLQNLGAQVSSDENTLTVKSAAFHGCTVDTAGDHRIAMAAAIAATVADGPVTILNAHCVAKSYPTFWSEYSRLGGNYEQYIR